MSVRVHILPNASGNPEFQQVEAGQWVEAPDKDFSVEVVKIGSGTATVEIHGTNDRTRVPSAGTVLSAFLLSGQGDLKHEQFEAAYLYKCAVVTDLSANTVKVFMGSYENG